DFFPTINEIRRVGHELTMKLEGRPSAEEAWTEVLAAVRRGEENNNFSHPDIENAMSVVGGRCQIGYSKLGYELDTYRRRFVDHYNRIAIDRQNSDFHPIMIEDGIEDGREKLRLVEGGS
ncbi:MAG: hypothetical protein JRD43_08900, partial [Deltaproteobacteria bacterium]|nr:hypothetical protein [Deltaproteobacteria bacterium]